MPDERAASAEFSPDRSGDDLTTIVTCSSEFEAATKVAVLKDAGIEAFTFGAVHSALPLALKALRVPVQVRAIDLERAKAVLQEIAEEAADVDWDSVDVGEREDALPLHAPGRRPALVWISVIIAALALLTVVVLFVVTLTS